MTGSGRVLKLESAQGTALVSLDTGAVMGIANEAPWTPVAASWRVLDRSPVSARIAAGTEAGGIELRYELDGRRLLCERRVAGGERQERVLELSAPMA